MRVPVPRLVRPAREVVALPSVWWRGAGRLLLVARRGRLAAWPGRPGVLAAGAAARVWPAAGQV